MKRWIVILGLILSMLSPSFFPKKAKPSRHKTFAASYPCDVMQGPNHIYWLSESCGEIWKGSKLKKSTKNREVI